MSVGGERAPARQDQVWRGVASKSPAQAAAGVSVPSGPGKPLRGQGPRRPRTSVTSLASSLADNGHYPPLPSATPALVALRATLHNGRYVNLGRARRVVCRRR